MITQEPISFYALVVEGDGWRISFQSKPEQLVRVVGRLPTLGEVRDTFAQSFPQVQMIVPSIVHVVLGEMHRHQAELKAAQDKVASLEDDGVVGGQDVVALITKERDAVLAEVMDLRKRESCPHHVVDNVCKDCGRPFPNGPSIWQIEHARVSNQLAAVTSRTEEEVRWQLHAKGKIVEMRDAARAEADALKRQLKNTEDAAEVTGWELVQMKKLLIEARYAGEQMSEALGNDECTIPWDDAVMPRLKEFR